MKLLLVEDDDKKREKILSFLDARFPSLEMEQAQSLNSGIRMVRSVTFDVILLDMTLPNFDIRPHESGGKMHNFGGIEFLKQLDRFDIATEVIVITQFETFGNRPHLVDFEQLDNQLVSDFSDFYRGIVYYHASMHDWEDNLHDKLTKIVGEDI